MKKWILLAFLGAAIPASAGIVEYAVNIDTSSLPGATAGSLFFSFGAGLSPYDAATATVSGFTGGTLDPGTLPADLVLDNSAPAQYQQGITYGSFLKFYLTLSGPALTSPSPAAVGGTDFALFLLDAASNPLLTDDPNGSVFVASIEAATGNTFVTTFTNAGGAPVASLDPVPEPGTVLSLLGGAALLLARRRPSRRAKL